MTLTNTINRIQYTGTGSVDTFSYPFRIFKDVDLKVTKRLVSTTVDILLVLGTDYTVAGVGDGGGGTITLVAGNLPTGDTLTIRRVVALQQETSLRNQKKYFGSVHEDAFDRTMQILQQHQDELDRSLKLPESEAGTLLATLLPAVADRLSKVLGYSADGLSLVAVSNVPTSGVTATAFAETLLDDANAAAARATLVIASVETVSPSLSGTNNNFAGFTLSAQTNFARITTSGDVIITGIVAGVAGQVLIIQSLSSDTVTFKVNNVGSAAANRILAGAGLADLTMLGGDLIMLIYDSAGPGWRVIS